MRHVSRDNSFNKSADFRLNDRTSIRESMGYFLAETSRSVLETTRSSYPIDIVGCSVGVK